MRTVMNRMPINESRYSLLFEYSMDGILLTSPDGRIFDANPSACSILGRTREQIISSTRDDLMNASDPAMARFVEDRKRTGRAHGELEARRPDGTIFPVEVSSVVFPSAEGQEFTCILLRDISRRKRAEAEREQNQREREHLLLEQARMEAGLRLAAIVESSDDAIIGKDIDGIVTDWNKGAERLYGYTADEVIGKPVSFLIPRDRLADFAEIMGKIRNGLSVNHFETTRQKKDGTLIEVSLRVSPILDKEGRVVGASAIARDISERKHQEVVLRESEEQFRTLAEAIPQLCWMARGDGHIFWYNQRWYTYTGTTPEQMEGWGWQSVHDPQTLPLVLERWKDSIATAEPFDMVFPLRAADGVFRPFLTRIVPIKDAEGEVVRWFGTNTDITELRDAQEALRKSEERLRLALHAARIGTFEWNLRTGVNTWTPELESLYGLPTGGFGGTEKAFENLVHPDDRARVRELVEMALKSGQPTRGEWRVVLPDGSLHWIAGRWQVFMDEWGEPSRMIGVNTDVTDQKLAEASLSEMTRKLVQAQEQERSRIARELHDDIGQRIAMLAVALDQLQGQSFEASAEVLTKVRTIREQTNEIADDLRVLSHDLHSSQLEYLGAVVGIRSWCKEFGERRKVDIVFANDVKSELPPEIALCLFRVVQETLQNAAKHSGATRVEVQLREHSGEIHLTVVDSGRGFDVEAVKQVKGLGLTSMRERVRLAGGTISIDSKPMGGGTKIHVRVSLGSEVSAQVAAGRATSVKDRHRQYTRECSTQTP